MSTPPRRHHGRRRPSRNPERITRAGATDEFDGLGRVEQLVLRGDGLTTTSLQILTGDLITVNVVSHWIIQVPELMGGTSSGMRYDDNGPDLDYYFDAARTYLDAAVGDELLIRDVLLVGANAVVHGSAEVIALSSQLPKGVASALATTDHPLGRILRDSGVPITRELRRWGLAPAGPHAATLGAGLTSSSRVPARTYLMRLAASADPLAVLTERFAPHVFA